MHGNDLDLVRRKKMVESLIERLQDDINIIKALPNTNIRNLLICADKKNGLSNSAIGRKYNIDRSNVFRCNC